MWDLIFNPLVTLLTWMYSIFNQDVVLAIVALTVLIRVVTYPLTAQQQRSAKKMQELQPELKKIQEKYKDDREKLSQAQMEFYREAGVNPLGGCFPLLLQFPILIGLYQAIFYALANSPYQLVDLSERLLIPGLDSLLPLKNIWFGMDLTQAPTPPLNPVYALALPALVMVTTYIQFKMTASSTSSPDANDQAAAMNRSMGTVMPIMFGMMSLSFSVGLSVYFIVSNVLGIAQYSEPGKRLLDRLYGDKPATPKTPAMSAKAGTESPSNSEKPPKSAQASEPSSSTGSKKKNRR